MTIVDHERRWPFPHLPQVVESRYGVADLALRPFALYESDLNVDFDRTPRPVLVTQLLECCTQTAQIAQVEQSFFWDLPVGKRTEALLTLLLSGAGSQITLAFRCPNTSCAETSEIEIAIEE